MSMMYLQFQASVHLFKKNLAINFILIRKYTLFAFKKKFFSSCLIDQTAIGKHIFGFRDFKNLNSNVDTLSIKFISMSRENFAYFIIHLKNKR